MRLLTASSLCFAERTLVIILQLKAKSTPTGEAPSCLFEKIRTEVIAPGLSSLINDALTAGSYLNLFYPTRVAAIQKSSSNFYF